MRWKKTCAMDERMRFVMAVEAQQEPFAAVCRRYGVSRKTGYKWLARSDAEHVWPVIEAALREFGLPRALRSDTGPPFASRGAGGLSRLSVKVSKAGVLPERIAPRKPQQNGRLERLHLTLMQDTASPPARAFRQQLERFQAFQRLHNDERPHAALGNDVPAEHYCPSPRRWDGVLREPDYGPDHEVRRVRRNGEIKWRGKLICLNQALTGDRSVSPSGRTAPGRPSMGRSCWGSSRMAAIG